jgi:hypothetical protein
MTAKIGLRRARWSSSGVGDGAFAGVVLRDVGCRDGNLLVELLGLAVAAEWPNASDGRQAIGARLRASGSAVLIAKWFMAALEAPEIGSKLAGLDHQPIGICGAEFRAFIHKQYGDYGRVIRESNIKAE